VWDTKIAAGSIFPIQNIINTEGQDGDNIFYETAQQERLLLLPGKNSAKYEVEMPLDQHQNAYANLNAKNWEMFVFDIFGNIIATQDSDGTIRGLTLAYFNVDRLNTATLDQAVLTKLDWDITDVNEININGVYLNPSFIATNSWFPTKLGGVLKVQTSSGAIAANAFTTAVSYVDTANYKGDGSSKTEVIPDLLIANFEVINQTGAVITPDSVTESATISGTYDIDCTAETITSGSVQVIPSTTALYKSEVETLS